LQLRIFRYISPQSHQIADPGRLVAFEQITNFGFGVAHANDVRHGRHVLVSFDGGHQVKCPLPRNGTAAVRDRHEGWVKVTQLVERSAQRRRFLIRFRREIFKRSGETLREQVVDEHCLVLSATVVVFESFNVIFAEVGAVLHFNEDDRRRPAVFNAVRLTQSNTDGITGT
jgi:hypothetical protein